MSVTCVDSYMLFVSHKARALLWNVGKQLGDARCAASITDLLSVRKYKSSWWRHMTRDIGYASPGPMFLGTPREP